MHAQSTTSACVFLRFKRLMSSIDDLYVRLKGVTIRLGASCRLRPGSSCARVHEILSQLTIPTSCYRIRLVSAPSHFSFFRERSDRSNIMQVQAAIFAAVLMWLCNGMPRHQTLLSLCKVSALLIPYEWMCVRVGADPPTSTCKSTCRRLHSRPSSACTLESSQFAVLLATSVCIHWLSQNTEKGEKKPSACQGVEIWSILIQPGILGRQSSHQRGCNWFV